MRTHALMLSQTFSRIHARTHAHVILECVDGAGSPCFALEAGGMPLESCASKKRTEGEGETEGVGERAAISPTLLTRGAVKQADHSLTRSGISQPL